MPAALSDKPRLSLRQKSPAELYPGINFSGHWHSAKQPRLAKLPNSAPDLIGKRTGRLKVIGLYPERRNGPARWVVRCTCGDYELRTAHAILNPHNENDKCQRCHEKGRAKHRQIVSRRKTVG